MKKVLFLMLFLLILGAAIVHAQVKIGDNTAPRTGAVLDLKTSYVGGLLLPNVSITDTAKIDFTEATLWNVDSKPELAGLIVYNTNETTGKGVYVWDGEKWLSITTGGGGGGGPVNPGCGTLTIDNQTADAPINVSAGTAVTLSVTASITDETTPTFQWYKNTVAGTSGATPITGSTTGGTSTLSPPTAAGTTTYYYCVVTNPCDATTDMSNNWVVTANPTGPGTIFLGMSTVCPYNNKSACTCTSGSPIAFSDASAEQLISAGPPNPGSMYSWWANTTNYTNWQDAITLTWTTAWYGQGSNIGYMACF